MSPAIQTGPGWAVLHDPALVINPGPDLLRHALEHGEAEGQAGRGRGQVRFFQVGDRHWAVRHYRRGGWMGRLVEDRYAWTGAERTRAFREWRMLARLHAAGLPVPRPVAAGWRRRGLFYTAELVTLRIAGAAPLSARLAEGAALDWRAIGRMLADFHALGACHADLNAHNILLDEDGRAWLLDFDRGRFRAPGPWQEQNLARLGRSLRKIAAEPGAPAFDPAGWRALRSGYAEGRDLRLRASGP